MNAITQDVIGHISEFLDSQEYLNFSVVTKQDWVFNREETKKRIRYSWIMPTIKANEDNWFIAKSEDLDWVAADLYVRPDLRGTYGHLKKSKDLCNYINELACALLRNQKFPYTFPIYWGWSIRYRPCYFAEKFASSTDLNSETIIYTNERVSILYRCRYSGKIRRTIKKSLTLRALVG